VAGPATRYSAFLCYSHRDSAWSKWLHRALEKFRIDRDLVGRETPIGLMPKTLRPVFRDDEDFSGGPRLTAATVDALHASAALLVLCSRASARRPGVNEEVRLFRSRHPDRPIIPIIVDDSIPDNLAPALRYELSADGTITDRPVTMVGPDLRDNGDGKTLGLAKIITALTGVGTDEILWRAERTRKHRQRFWAAFVGLCLLLAVVASGSAIYVWRQLKTNEAFLDATLKHATETVNAAVTQAKKYNLSGTAMFLVVGKAEGLFNNLAERGRPTAGLRYRRAWMLIQFARNYQILGDTGRQYARATKAHGLLTGLGAEKSDDIAYRHDLAVAYDEIGDMLLAQGKLPEALKSYRDGLAIGDETAKADPTNAAWLRDLSASYGKVGDLLVAQGELTEALKSYRDSLAVRERLAQGGPSNAARLSDLSVSYDKVGDMLMAESNRSEALKFYRDGLAIRVRLTNAAPSNAAWLSDLSASYDKVGDVLMAEGNRSEALKYYRDGLAIGVQIAKANPTSAAPPSVLSVSYNKIGDVLMAEGHRSEALTYYRNGLAIRVQIAKANPTNAARLSDLSVSYNKVGDVLMTGGNLDEALKSFQEGLAVKKQLVMADPTNAAGQRDLWASYNKIGEMLVAQGFPGEALQLFRGGIAVGERLAKADPTNTSWQRELSASYNKIGEMLVSQGDLDEGLKSHRNGLVIAERLAAADPSNTEWQDNLQFSIGRIGRLAHSFVLAHSFERALEAAELIHSASPGTILFHTYRARALMFLGRVDEARALYGRYRLEKNVKDGKSWETLVLEDFAELRKAGLHHPLMNEIEKQFRARR
jgi:tetratricopeptide (TPR) repeat protein